MNREWHTWQSLMQDKITEKIIACSSSIGPGAANMVTAAACASVNNILLLLLPGDTFATRQPDPVLQQIEQPLSPRITRMMHLNPFVNIGIESRDQNSWTDRILAPAHKWLLDEK
jgi:TPP-dependent trihydroxycyclohexane-1,2-dione (THcHDO) dehydratase